MPIATAGIVTPADKVVVIDASALAAILFGEPLADAILPRLTGVELVAPALLGFELANVCLTKLRRHPAQRDALLAAYRGHAAIRVETCDVDHDQVLDLADRAALTSYDASYLWLARVLSADLVTLDRKLADAAAVEIV